MDYTRLMHANQVTRVNNSYVDNFHIHEVSEERYLYYVKSDLDAGIFRGIFDGLHFVELDDSIRSLTRNKEKTYFLVHPWNFSWWNEG